MNLQTTEDLERLFCNVRNHYDRIFELLDQVPYGMTDQTCCYDVFGYDPPVAEPPGINPLNVVDVVEVELFWVNLDFGKGSVQGLTTFSLNIAWEAVADRWVLVQPKLGISDIEIPLANNMSFST